MKTSIAVLFYASLVLVTLSCDKEENKPNSGSTSKFFFDENLSVKINGVTFQSGDIDIQYNKDFFVLTAYVGQGRIGMTAFIDTDNPYSNIGDTNILPNHPILSNYVVENQFWETASSGYLIINSFDFVNGRVSGTFAMTTGDSLNPAIHTFTEGTFEAEDPDLVQ